MIGVASKADGDIVRKTEVLRASADELALKTEDQGNDLAKLRNAIEQLKTDQSSHITRAIARMGEIDAELKHISDEKIQYDRRTADALKDIESIRRELVQLGAKLAKEFITLPLPVARYPRLDQSSQKDEFVLLSQNKEKERNQNSPSPRNKNNNNNNSYNVGNSATTVNSIWYTDDQPAANLQCIDLVISSAVAALDGRLTDQEFREEIEASRNDPESVFSKESLIRSVAAASPMKRRRASLLMLAQASRELQKQSATIDDLTRGPMRWSEVERIQAEKNVQMHDGMIRDAVRELCKVAPVPRQAERQLLTALDLHAMPTYRNLDGSSSSPVRSSSPTSHDESKNSGSGFDFNGRKDSPSDVGTNNNNNNNNMNSRTVKISQPPSLQLKRKKLTNTFSTSNYLLTNVSMEELGEAVERYADMGNRDENARYSPRDAKIREEEMARQNLQMYGESVVSKPKNVSSPAFTSRTKDPMLRQLQAELQEEQSAMGLRSHAARVKAWQELDLKRAAKSRFNVNDVSNANNLASIEKRQINLITMNSNKIDNNSALLGGSPCASTTTGTLLLQNDLLIPSSLAGVYSSVMMQSAAVYSPSSTPSASSPARLKNNHILSSPGRKSTPTIIPARIISPKANASPHCAQSQLRSASLRTPTSINVLSDKNRKSTSTPPPTQQQQQQQQQQAKTSNFGGITSEAINSTASPLIVHRSTGLIVRPQHQQHHIPPQVGEVIRKNKSNSASFIMTSNNNNNYNSINNYNNTGTSSPGSFLFNNNHLQTNSASLVDSQLIPTTTSTMTNASPASINLATAKAGIPDPINATQAVSMRRTGALEAAGLSFHSSRLDEAAKRLGVVRPPSAGAGYCARNGIGSRMHWKLKNRPHELEEDARLMSEEATKRNDPQSLD